MIRSLLICAMYLSFLIIGTSAPFIISLGYVWVDAFTPQAIAYIILPSIPVSLIMALAAIVAYCILDRKFFPRPSLIVYLLLLLAVWITITTFCWSVVPDFAYLKWSSAVKVVLFSAFMPLVFRSRVQIESFLQVYLFSLSVQFLPGGLKTMISGGGYGMALGVVSGNSGLSEGSTLAAVSLMLVPIIIYLRTHTRLLKRSLLTDFMYFGLAVAAVAASIGTYERTALVGMFVVASGLWVRTKRKFLGLLVGGIAVVVIMSFVSDGWTSRIQTTADPQESSALGRELVWQWTLNYVSANPQGGGFDVYRIDRIIFPGTAENPEPLVVYGKAFHSMYFEVLGEQGWIGLALFLGLCVATLWSLQSVSSKCRGIAELSWCRDLAHALQISLVTLLACGAFIGIAFQPMVYYLFAIALSINNFVKRVQGGRTLKRLALSERRSNVLVSSVS